jgi:hypothetical protein
MGIALFIYYLFICLFICLFVCDRLCGLVVIFPGYRSRGPSFDFRRYQIFREVVSSEPGTFSLIGITVHCADHTTPSAR